MLPVVHFILTIDDCYEYLDHAVGFLACYTHRYAWPAWKLRCRQSPGASTHTGGLPGLLHTQVHLARLYPESPQRLIVVTYTHRYAQPAWKLLNIERSRRVTPHHVPVAVPPCLLTPFPPFQFPSFIATLPPSCCSL